MGIDDVIAQLRNEKNLSQKQLAQELNVSTGTVGMWETHRRYPTFDALIQLMDYFAVSADTLLDGERKLTPEQYRAPVREQSPEIQKILATFVRLDEDNKDILIGKAKELLKSQKAGEKRT